MYILLSLTRTLLIFSKNAMSLVSTGTLWYNPSYTFALHPLYFVRPPLFIYVTLMSPEVNRICDPGGVQCGQVSHVLRTRYSGVMVWYHGK